MAERLKVLQLCAVGFTVEKLLLPLVDAMSRDYDVTVACSYDPTTDRLRGRGYKVYNINIDRKITPIGNMRSVFALCKFMKQENFDIVHVHTPVAGILGRIAAKLAKVPVVIYTAHGFYFHDNMPSLKRWLFVEVEKLGGRLSSYIFTQSQEDYETAIAAGIIKKDRITAIGNGVNIEKFSIGRVGNDTALKLRQEFGITDGDVVVGIIGRVVREKGYVEWVQAAAKLLGKHSNVKFLAIGDTLESDRDGIKATLDQMVQDHHLKGKVIFAGSRSDIPDLLAIMDIFTLPSYREGMPRSLIEAMCMGKPAVATNIRGCREEVEEGITGFLVPVADVVTLADKIEYLIENPGVRLEMGEQARSKAEREFDEAVVIQRQLDIISGLIKR